MSEKAEKVKGGGRQRGAAPTESEPRARGPAVPKSSVAEVKTARVFVLTRLMATGDYNEAKAAELAAEWGVTPHTVVTMACEAKRILEITTNDRKALVDTIRLRLTEIAGQDGPDRTQALRTLLEHLGELRKRVEVSGPQGAPISVEGKATVVIMPAEQEPTT